MCGVALIILYKVFYCCERFITVMQTVVNEACFAAADTSSVLMINFTSCIETLNREIYE